MAVMIWEVILPFIEDFPVAAQLVSRGSRKAVLLLHRLWLQRAYKKVRATLRFDPLMQTLSLARLEVVSMNRCEMCGRQSFMLYLVTGAALCRRCELSVSMPLIGLDLDLLATLPPPLPIFGKCRVLTAAHLSHQRTLQDCLEDIGLDRNPARAVRQVRDLVGQLMLRKEQRITREDALEQVAEQFLERQFLKRKEDQQSR